MVLLRFIGKRPMKFNYKGRKRTLKPGELIELPPKVIKRLRTTKGRELFEVVGQVHEKRLKRAEKYLRWLVQQALAHGWGPPP